MTSWMERGADLLGCASRILVFSGAGLSTESGIPDFRSPGGIWQRYNPAEFAFDRFVADPKARATYWRMSTEMWETLRSAAPNRGHLAVKALEDRGRILAVVTQNIDRLHQAAGSDPEKVIEVHGQAMTVSCLSCGKTWEREIVQGWIAGGVAAPVCDRCSGILKPDTVSFGQAMPEEKMEKAYSAAASCDLCLVLGSSLVVYPAATIPVHAMDHGARLMIVNLGPTPLDHRADLLVRAPIASALGDMVERVAGVP